MRSNEKVRNASVLFVLIFLASPGANASPPEYFDDPFGDSDFKDAPLILDIAHPTKGRGQLSLLFASSIIDKYTNHMGGLLEFDYSFTDTLGAAIAVGLMHGQLTNIVTDEGGIIGNIMQKCMDPSANACGGGLFPTADNRVPDYKQITGVIDALAVWAPLYGKINVVSEIDVNLQAFIVAGAGVHGRREVVASTSGSPRSVSDYTLTGDGFGDGGFLDDMKVHGTVGVGMQVFILDWLSLRAEARGLLYLDEFDFGEGNETYLSQFWFFQSGLGFILF